MPLHKKHKKTATLMTICCILILMAAISPVRAASRSRVLSTALLVSGIGLKFGSIFIENSAQDSYDQYLSTANQADIAKHRDNYSSKHDLSVALSRTGVGFVGLAVLLSIFDELDLISKSSPSQPVGLNIKPNYNLRTQETVLLFERRF